MRGKKKEETEWTTDGTEQCFGWRKLLSMKKGRTNRRYLRRGVVQLIAGKENQKKSPWKSVFFGEISV